MITYYSYLMSNKINGGVTGEFHVHRIARKN